jgi:hypothetical protein
VHIQIKARIEYIKHIIMKYMQAQYRYRRTLEVLIS